MKTKGKRQSTNVEIQEPAVTYSYVPELGVDGSRRKAMSDGNYRSHSKEEIAVAKELGKHNRNKTTPVPTPRPNQVTPGEWKTKNKI